MRKILLGPVIGAFLLLGAGVHSNGLPPFPAPQLAGTVSEVIDGDTIKVHLSSGETETVRYLSINTPELAEDECYARKAREINFALVQGRQLYLETDQEQRDQYGRLLAYVYLDEQGHAMVNLMLIAIGAADIEIREPNTRYENIFRQMRDLARSLKLGLWSECTASATVRITRVLPNPVGEEPDDEWIEVCNKGPEAVDISGWQLTDNEGVYSYPNGTVLAPPGQENECKVVTGKEYNPTGNPRDLFLSNSGDEVILRNAGGKEVDRCEFGKTSEGQIVICADP